MVNNAPTLLVVFNRPDYTQIVFDSIRKAQVKKLYISVDAPRHGNSEDEKNCAKVREIVSKIEWECDVIYRFSKINQGCGPGPFNAITWAFENEDRLIILEDDCVPALPFFYYCDELLEKYKDDTRIWIISGNQYNEEAVTTPHSYFFSRYGHSWGWATWKRCWKFMDMRLSKYPKIIEQDLFKSAFYTDKEVDFFQKIVDNIYNNESLRTHIWDYQFGFAIRANGGLSIVPRKNLVSNIGYAGTHSNTKSSFHDRLVDENYKIISHPEFILPDVNYDNYHFKNHVNRTAKIRLSKRIWLMIKRIIKWIVKNESRLDL